MPAHPGGHLHCPSNCEHSPKLPQVNASSWQLKQGGQRSVINRWFRLVSPTESRSLRTWSRGNDLQWLQKCQVLCRTGVTMERHTESEVCGFKEYDEALRAAPACCAARSNKDVGRSQLYAPDRSIMDE